MYSSLRSIKNPKKIIFALLIAVLAVICVFSFSANAKNERQEAESTITATHTSTLTQKPVFNTVTATATLVLPTEVNLIPSITASPEIPQQSLIPPTETSVPIQTLDSPEIPDQASVLIPVTGIDHEQNTSNNAVGMLLINLALFFIGCAFIFIGAKTFLKK